MPAAWAITARSTSGDSRARDKRIAHPDVLASRNGSSIHTGDAMPPKAVITAATAGIGLETAKELARRGFAVTVIGRDPQRGHQATAQIGGEARFLRTD